MFSTCSLIAYRTIVLGVLVERSHCNRMDSEILNIEEIVMGRGLPDPPPEVPPEKPAAPCKPVIRNGPPAASVQPCKWYYSNRFCVCTPLKDQLILHGVSNFNFHHLDQHENLQCFQCFITFCSAKAKERHMKKSHREEYKQQLQQVRSQRHFIE